MKHLTVMQDDGQSYTCNVPLSDEDYEYWRDRYLELDAENLKAEREAVDDEILHMFLFPAILRTRSDAEIIIDDKMALILCPFTDHRIVMFHPDCPQFTLERLTRIVAPRFVPVEVDVYAPAVEEHFDGPFVAYLLTIPDVSVSATYAQLEYVYDR